MLPSKHYTQHCEKHNLAEDPGQNNALHQLDRLWQDLATEAQLPAPKWPRLFKHKSRPPIPGIYLWGGVGRGKTMLMDIFFASLKTSKKERQHYHHFMLEVHRALRRHRRMRDPLKLVARDIAKTSKLLCLDEFHVTDITDAMLLHTLLQALLVESVVLVTTSNFHPDDLYADGLQRARFLPAIELLKTQNEVVALTGTTDYRQQTLRKDGTWHSPLNMSSEESMKNAFETLSSHCHSVEQSIDINGRKLSVLGQAEGTVWFDFKTLCDSPRSQIDYIEIACQHHSVLISNLPLLNDQHADAVRRLLNLLDVFYDHRVKLIISAAAPITKIYSGEKLVFEFERAISRLTEMQSEEYLAKAHGLIAFN